MAAKLKREITSLSSAKNDLETVKKDEDDMDRLERICRFPDPGGHENYHVGEAGTIRKRLDKKIVELLETQVRSG